MKKLKYIALILFFSFNVSFANENIEINIINGDNIDKQTIYSILDTYSEINDDQLNDIIKKLKKNKYISDVNILKKDNTYIINISQYRIINDVKFKGLKRFKKSNLNLILPFDDYLKVDDEKQINKFINELKELYYSYAYNKINIEYELQYNNDNQNFTDIQFNINEGKISKINKINFIGNSFFKRGKLLDNIKSQQRNYLKLRIFNNFKYYVVDNDIIRLRKLYLDSGFRDIKIESKTEYLESNNKFNIYFYINEGKLYSFNKFNLKINLSNLNTDQIKEIKNNFDNLIDEKFNKDKTFNISSINAIEKNISELLYDKGYSFFDIKIEEQLNNQNININFIISDSPPKYAKEIIITGNKRTLDKVIRRNIHFAEGDPFNDQDITNVNTRLRNLNFFKKIDIDTNKLNGNDYSVNVDVDERPTGDFQIGLTFGTIEGATLITELNEKNIAGTGRDLSFVVNTSEDKSKYKLSSKEPFAFNQPIDLLYGVEFNEKDLSSSSSYKVDTLKFDSGINFDISNKLKYGFIVNYELKDYSITDSSTASSSIIDSSGKNIFINFINSLDYYDLDSFFNPTEGTSLFYQNKISPSTNSNGSLIKNEIVHRKFIPINESIFSIQTKLGNITSLENKEILNDNKFSLGGSWLRGFDSFGVGPRNSYTSYQGGNNVIVTKFDYDRPINKISDNPVYLTIFSDVGKVWGNKTDPTSSSESIRSSYGYGIKWYSPIGPLGFSWAFPINDEDYDIKRSFLFSIGNIN
tara:strand:+ start:41 stop:2302 length:2262 start_codon:yes stop_codon:yes gene_type:complete